MSDVKIGSLFMELGLDVNQTKLNDVVQAIGKLNFNSVLSAVGVGALVDGLKQIMEVGQGLTEPIYQFSRETGLSGQRMQQWTEYAKKMGVQGDVVASSLGGLQKKMAGIQFGDSSLLSGIYLLQQAGANISQGDLNDPFSFLNKAVEGLQKIKPELRTYVAGLLGLNEQVLLLKTFHGADAFPTPTTQQVDAIREYTAAWSQFGTMFRQVVTDLASEFAPDLKNLADALSGFFSNLHENARALRGGIEALIGALSLALGPIAQIGYLIAMVSLHIKDIQNAVKTISFTKGISDSDLWKVQPVYRPAEGASGSSPAGVTMHNAITIIAHGIEDLEHKVAAFFEKTIAKSFYQNSQNY